MFKSSRVGVLMAILALSGVLAASASWRSGIRTVTGRSSTTNAGASRLVLHGPSGPVVMECTSSTGIGTLRGPTAAGPTAPGIATVVPLFGGPCLVSGVPGFSATCSGASLNASSYSGGTTFATAGAGATQATISGIDCVVAAAVIPCSTITGTVDAHYFNPIALNGSSPSILDCD